jgi:hypothetical protein
MGDEASGSTAYLYAFGEAHDDLRAAFYIDERAHSDPALAHSVVESAEAAMTRAGVIYQVEVTSGGHVETLTGVPTWEEFKQRHFVEGVPLPVRHPPRELATPPSWQTLIAAVQEARRDFRAELVSILAAALPGGKVSITSDPGAIRRSRGSVDWGEERFGFEIAVSAGLDDAEPAAVLASVSEVIEQRGWLLTDRVAGGVAVGAERRLFAIWADARPSKVTVLGQSPLYRSPSDPGSAFVVEPR